MGWKPLPLPPDNGWLLNVVCNDNGGKLNAGNDRPAAAAALIDCNRAVECSSARRRSSATDVDRISDVVVGMTTDTERFMENVDVLGSPAAIGLIIGQHVQEAVGKPKLVLKWNKWLYTHAAHGRTYI